MASYQGQSRALSDLSNFLVRSATLSFGALQGASLQAPEQPKVISNNFSNNVQQENLAPAAAAQPVQKRTGKWTEEEDAKLRALVEKNGARNWKTIGEIHGSRDGKQCRDRWTQYLDPNLIKTAFSEEDDRIILESISKGQKWSYIAVLLPGRCANDIKNYYNTYLKKKRKPGSEDFQPPPSKRQAFDDQEAATVAKTTSVVEKPLSQPQRTIQTTLPDILSLNNFLAPSSNHQQSVNSLHLPTTSSESPQKPIYLPPPSLLSLSPLFSPLRHRRTTLGHSTTAHVFLPPTATPPAAAAPQQAAMATNQLQLAQPTNLQHKFEAASDGTPAYEQGPANMESNLSFFFCDEELEPLGDVFMPTIPLAHDTSFG